MGLFNKHIKAMPHFAYRSEAFDYYFAKGIEEGKDDMTAAEQADRFANIIAMNKHLSDAPPAQMSAIEKGVAYAKQIVAIKRDNPDLWDLITSVAGGIIGGFAGGATVASIQEPSADNIDFEKL